MHLLVLVLLCHHCARKNIVDSRVHLLTMHKHLKNVLGNYNMESKQTLQVTTTNINAHQTSLVFIMSNIFLTLFIVFQTTCFSFSLVTANAYHTGIISGEEASKCVEILKDLTSKHCQVRYNFTALCFKLLRIMIIYCSFFL